MRNRFGLTGGWKLLLVVSMAAGGGVTTGGACGCNGTPSGNSKPGDGKPPVPPVPRLEVTTTLDVGEVKLGEQYTHSFELANTGGQPLQLKVVRKSCDCTDVNLEPATIPPGGKGKAKFVWVPRPHQDGKTDVTVSLETNDPNREKVDLLLKAEVHQPIRVAPRDPNYFEVFFKEFLRGADVSDQVAVFSTVYDDFPLDAKLEKEKDFPWLKITKDDLGGVKEINGVPNVKSGYWVRITPTADIPEGYFQNTLVLTFTDPADKKSRTVKMPVSGTVATTSIKVIPKEVEFRKKTLTEPDSKKLLVKFGDPLPAKEAVEVVKCEPSFIKATKPNKVGNMWEITVYIPKDYSDAQRHQLERHQLDGYLRGFIELQTSASKKPVKVRLKWDAPG
jgi:hypothetical protein